MEEREHLVEAPSLRSQVYERLREDIVSGALSPGTRISPAEVAQRFGISQMPVRDALALLERDGLVETSARRWTRVVELSSELVEELIPVVSILEQHAVAEARDVSPEGLARLRAANDAFVAAIERGDAQEAVVADATFHDTLVALAANGTLERALADARTRIRLLRPQVLRLEDARRSAADHDEIVACLERGDRRAAARALARNWQQGLARFRARRI